MGHPTGGDGTDFRILGPLDVRDGEESVVLARPKLRALLGALLLRSNEVVPAGVLVEELWGERPPASVANALQVYVSQLRQALGTGVTIATRTPGYVLEIDPGHVDLWRFEQHVARSRERLAAGVPSEALSALDEALALWRGPALADVPLELSGASERARLEDLRVAVHEDRAEALLALGRHAEAVVELEALVSRHPLRERLRSQLMVALYRCGRQADALEAYRDARATLVDELGIEPGAELQRLERRILTQDPALAPPALPAAPASGGTPTPATALLGRERELEQLVQLVRMRSARLVTLTGPGGVGKTRLAVELAHTMGEEVEGGAVYISLGAIADPALVGPTLAEALGIAVGEGRSPGEALARALAPRTLLLILDNFEQLLPAAMLLSELLAAAPRLQLVVTSRAALRLAGERELPVRPLGLPAKGDGLDAIVRSPAVALFLDRARAVRPDFALTEETAIAAASVCARLDGLPLAIELAAARSKIMQPAAILERIDHSLGLLTSGASDAPERHRSLRATLDWSYELLDEDDRKLLARLGVFVGGASLEAAEQVCGADGLAVLDALAGLVDKSLLSSDGGDPPRFALLETVREYALERLVASGEEEPTRSAHAAFYLALAEEAEPQVQGPEQSWWVQRLAREHGNFRSALAFIFERGDGETALRLAVGLRRYWHLKGYLDEGRGWLERALAAAPDAPELLRTKALSVAGAIAGEQGDFDAARALLERSVAVARTLGDPVRTASGLTNLGNIFLYSGDYAGARALYRESAELTRGLSYKGHIAVTTENLGAVAFAEGALDLALELFSEAEQLAREAGVADTRASCLRSLGRTCVLRGELARAAGLFRRALALTRSLGGGPAVTECVEGLASVEAFGGDAARAAVLFGAVDAARAVAGASRPPDQARWIEQSHARALERLGRKAFREAYRRGEAVPLGAAIDLAVGTEAEEERRQRLPV